MARLSDHNIAVVLLAAGRGSRMGAAPKLLLPLHDGLPVLRHSTCNALALHPTEVIVVVRPDLPALAEALEGLPVRIVTNPRFDEGMSTSIQAGIAALDEAAQAALLLLGDEPHVFPAIIDALVAVYASAGKPITIPLYGDEVGPPAIFARSFFPELDRLTGDAGARQLVALYPDLVAFVQFPAEARPRDIDTPEDYQSARLSEP